MAIENIEFRYNESSVLEFRKYEAATWSAWEAVLDANLTPPVGTVVVNPYSYIEWLPCVGQQYPVTAYPALALARPDLVADDLITLPIGGAIRAN